jgi:CBS domain-containing protein
MLGFEQVYDYVPGKVDWLARNLPTQGEKADTPRVGALARDDVVTCRPDDPVGPLRERVRDSPYGFALVTTGDGTLLGRLRGSVIDEANPAETAEDTMSPGPSTVRADTAVGDLRDRLDKKDLKTAIVSDPEGRLIGVVTRKTLD